MSEQSPALQNPHLQMPRYGVWPFILPFVVFMLISMLEPGFPTLDEDVLAPGTIETIENSSEESSESIKYVINERKKHANRFFLIYGLKVVVITGLLVFYWKSYLTPFPISATWWSVATGVVGIAVWIGLCSIGLETAILESYGWENASNRSHFNPFTQLPIAWQLYVFLAIRFFGLVVMVPLLEELFLRGFLMRYVESPEWWAVNLGRLAFRTLLVAPVYGLLTHPTEALAAIVWFSLVTFLVAKTGKFWDAVIAHAVTNLLLGLYVCYFGQWHLW